MDIPSPFAKMAGRSAWIVYGWLKDHSAKNLPITIWPEGSLECEQTMALVLFFWRNEYSCFGGRLSIPDGMGDYMESSFIQFLRCKVGINFVLKRTETNMLLPDGGAEATF